MRCKSLAWPRVGTRVPTRDAAKEEPMKPYQPMPAEL